VVYQVQATQKVQVSNIKLTSIRVSPRRLYRPYGRTYEITNLILQVNI
jgi:hypothetical protein